MRVRVRRKEPRRRPICLRRLTPTWGASAPTTLHRKTATMTNTHTAAELAAILAGHKLWSLSVGMAGSLANLRDADLRGAYLAGANLRRADLRGAYLSRADLTGANLRHADLSHADLSHADLAGANLRRADLSHADLSRADLTGANLTGATTT